MNETLLRIRKVFEESGKTQVEIGKKISKTSQYVWKLLNDDTANPSDSVIKDIAREFIIDEEWLRTGKGQMKPNFSRNQEISVFANELLLELDDSFRKKFILALTRLDSKDWEVIEKIIENIK
jgi:transcriptional regulator with XRE-family HTH domain